MNHGSNAMHDFLVKKMGAPGDDAAGVLPHVAAGTLLGEQQQHAPAPWEQMGYQHDGDLGMEDDEFHGGEGAALEGRGGSLHVEPLAALQDWHPRGDTLLNMKKSQWVGEVVLSPLKIGRTTGTTIADSEVLMLRARNVTFYNRVRIIDMEHFHNGDEVSAASFSSYAFISTNNRTIRLPSSMTSTGIAGTKPGQASRWLKFFFATFLEQGSLYLTPTFVRIRVTTHGATSVATLNTMRAKCVCATVFFQRMLGFFSPIKVRVVTSPANEVYCAKRARRPRAMRAASTGCVPSAGNPQRPLRKFGDLAYRILHTFAPMDARQSRH